jgi:hypothetical protein
LLTLTYNACGRTELSGVGVVTADEDGDAGMAAESPFNVVVVMAAFVAAGLGTDAAAVVVGAEVVVMATTLPSD